MDLTHAAPRAGAAGPGESPPPDILGKLRLVWFLAQVPSGDLQQLAAVATLERHSARTVLFRQGDRADRFYVVVAGHIALFLDGLDDPAKIARIVGPGETIGEACVCGNGVHPVSAQLFGAGEVIAIPSEALCALFSQRFETVLGMLSEMSIRLRHQVRQIMDLKTKTTAQRLGGYLAALSDADAGTATLRLPYEKKLLASHLGMQPETLSRALMKLQTLGVRYQKNLNAFVVRDVALLRAFCDEPNAEG